MVQPHGLGRSIVLSTTRIFFDAFDPIAWRKWHHWNIAHNVAKRRRNVLIIRILTEGNMNLACFDFKPAQ